MSLKVLAVDDSETIRTLLKASLSRYGFEVVSACDGEQAFQALKKDSFDLVITDINMPIMNGFDLIKAIRACSCYASLPILVLSTENTGDKKRDGLHLGVTGWIAKPFDPQLLMLKIEKVCYV